MAKTLSRTGHRLAFLDWTRGFAALIMLQGHVFHSFTAKDLRNDGPYTLSQFCGGLTPAVFLFLTGVTLGFLMDSSAKKGLGAWDRVQTSARRAGFLLAVAFLFRFQMWSFAMGQSPWTDLFKVDILNCMALGIVALSPLAVFETRERVRNAVITGLAIASAAPLINAMNLSGVHPLVRAWFEPNPNFFAFFPWAAFIAFGLAAGSVLRLAEDNEMHRVMQWAAMMGFGLLFGAQYFANLPYSVYTNSDFWVNSPALILMKTGIILLLASFAFLWTRHMNPNGWSFVRQLGGTSLLVYWVHTELVYGRWFGAMKESLTAGQAVVMAVLIITLMVLLSVARTGWKDRPGFPVWFRQQWNAWRAEPMAQPAGD
ncbi:MAG: DUF1624 domain-containing protein [Bryobacterales bacterium]|nr:DUF1624 domain-containing protein [Bryobacterales bacterium]